MALPNMPGLLPVQPCLQQMQVHLRPLPLLAARRAKQNRRLTAAKSSTLMKLRWVVAAPVNKAVWIAAMTYYGWQRLDRGSEPN